MFDPEKMVAIDIHTHAEEPCGTHTDDGYEEFQAGMSAYFKMDYSHPPTIPETAAYFRERKIGAVIFPVDCERETGYRRYNNEEMAELTAAHDDVLIPFGSIDPAKGKTGAREARRLVEHFGIRGFKFHPTMQGFYPNDRAAYVLYEAIAEAGVPALFHTGQTGVGSGMRGGNGMRLKYSNPLYLDDVAVDFPDMPIVLAHPSFPVAGRSAVGGDPQAQRLYRSFRLVAEILPADPGALCQFTVEGKGAVRIGLAGDHTRSVAQRLRQARHQDRGAAVDPEGKCQAPAGHLSQAGSSCGSGALLRPLLPHHREQ